MIFKSVGDGRPYPTTALASADWTNVAPRVVRLDSLITVKRTLDLETLLDEHSTFFGDLFPHVVQWSDAMYLEDGLHRALRAALHGRPTIHARVMELTTVGAGTQADERGSS
ncbi:MAG TPA: type II toxin-antitoxin system VapB family antitoxin [Candidatus Nanopelagicales bacterium]|nr:type II toxin-antitoxin system VapB family antitoxin [Candidatus Nanopelagicales bacterium]